ncbi:MAG: aldo/keto reductase [Bdellovibrionales bacterium]|nr:aldo/keto reductase [Bdellovibrionales bacterium]
MKKLGLGTVQFGLPYGVSNAAGQTSGEEVSRILAVAGRAGMDLLDTAAAYGESEAVIGRSAERSSFRIVTKTPRISADGATAVRAAFESSLEKLRIPRVDGLLVHHAGDLLGPEGDAVWSEMLRLRDAGLVANIGASVYTGAEIDSLLSRFPIELIQIPFNVLDQRLLRSGHLARLKANGVEIHARSAFLQGLLLMDFAKIDPWFDPYRGLLDDYACAIATAGLSPLEAALGYSLSVPEIDRVICGVNNATQLEEILIAAKKTVDPRSFSAFASEEPLLLDPSRWKLVRR